MILVSGRNGNDMMSMSAIAATALTLCTLGLPQSIPSANAGTVTSTGTQQVRKDVKNIVPKKETTQTVPAPKTLEANTTQNASVSVSHAGASGGMNFSLTLPFLNTKFSANGSLRVPDITASPLSLFITPGYSGYSTYTPSYYQNYYPSYYPAYNSYYYGDTGYYPYY